MQDNQLILKDIRSKMKRQGVDAMIIPSSDSHQSEYTATHWQTRAWVSGFTGSAGTAVISRRHAGLWTDSRYFIQAEQELSEGEFELHKLKVPHTAGHLEWLLEHLKSGDTVGVDGNLFSEQQVVAMKSKLDQKRIKLKTNITLIYSSWKDRPSLPQNPIFELKLKYAGQSRKDKLLQICDLFSDRQIDYCLVSTLDDIAWILNLRGSDVESNPVFTAFLLVGKNKSYLFVDPEKISKVLYKKLVKDKVIVKKYEEVGQFLQKASQKSRILYDPSVTSIALASKIKKTSVVKGATPSTYLKAIKNPTEVKGIRKAMVKDGVALTRLYMWLEENIASNKIDEVEVAEKLASLRAEQGEYFGESFGAIVGYKGNGAIVHYSAKRPSCAMLKPKGVLLLDSGGQYHCGTTDITRTTCFSKPSKQLMKDYTAVLKGHIAVATCVFAKGTRGHQLDLLARRPLWAMAQNYGHGTGHGVGHFLNVHEGPQSISPALGGKAALPFAPGMFTSNEPGFYKEGAYGIRIENLILTVEVAKNEYGTFYGFETLTLFPIETTMIAHEMLTREEVVWLNKYHKKVYKTLAAGLKPAEKRWLKDKCKAI